MSESFEEMRARHQKECSLSQLAEQYHQTAEGPERDRILGEWRVLQKEMKQEQGQLRRRENREKSLKWVKEYGRKSRLRGW